MVATMDLLSAGDLVRLAESGAGTRLSLFLPLHRDGRQADGRIRAKNLIRQAERTLLARGASPAEADTLVRSARDVLEDPWLAGGRARGIAVFVDQAGARSFPVPLRLPELAVLGRSFAIGPLLPMLGAVGPFYVLAVNQDEIGLFRGTRFGIEPVDLDGLELATWLTLPRVRSAQVHAFLADRGGAGDQAVFHGVAGERDTRKARTLQHFRGVDRAIREIVAQDGAPLVLAGLSHLQASYREANTYPHLLDQGIGGNPHGLDAAMMHRAAWALVEPALRGDERAALGRYAGLQGTGRTLEDPIAAVAAAEQGRIDTVLVAAEQVTGNPADPARVDVRLSTPAGATEQLERLVLATLRAAGSAYVVPARQLPTRSPLAAILRY